MPSNQLPPAIAEIVEKLSAIPGAVAVTLGGSRGPNLADAASDWDLGLYYRGEIDLSPLAAAYGVVNPPGAWGRLMNGGAWLELAGMKVDVILRDLDTVEYWAKRAEAGEFEVDLLLGYLAGIPTYSLCAEISVNRVLSGQLPPLGDFPEKLKETAPPNWRFRSRFSLDYARMHARRGNLVGATGQTAKAVFEEAHARACEAGRWALNEKRLLAGLDHVHSFFSNVPAESAELLRWIDGVAEVTGL
jgi:hypothetical protein